MPPKKNQALIDKFKAMNEMKKRYGVNASPIPSLKDKVKDAVKKTLGQYEEWLNQLMDLTSDMDNRLKQIESILFDEETPEKKS